MIRNIKRILLGLSIAAAIAFCYFFFLANDYQTKGKLSLSVLDSPVTIRRDQLSIPYIEAQSMPDLLRAQGFIVGQERLYQAQLFRLLALGRLSEVFGEAGVNNDTLVKLVNLEQIAIQFMHALDQPSRDYYTHYIEGLNAYITDHKDEHPLSVKLLKMPQEVWTLQDIVTLQLFQSWANSSLWRNELLTQKIIEEVGVLRAQQIAQVSINPNDESVVSAQLTDRNNPNKLQSDRSPNRNSQINKTSHIAPGLFAVIPDALGAGSNAWATGNRKSTSGKPIFANNPHLPATTLPGFWLPMGLFTPDFSAVGVTAPGSPGIGVGRNQHIAYGATVGGGDGVDLYIEKLDPANADHYLEGDKSLALEIREDAFKIKDNSQENGYRTQRLRIRSTTRGPLISDHGISSDKDQAISLAWAVIGTQTASLGSDRLLFAKDIDEALDAISHFPASLSHVVADSQGGIARISGGRIPNRIVGDGARPLSVESLAKTNYQSWSGLIPKSDMPKEMNPKSDWVGTANHRIVSKDYPYEFSKDFAPAWRYRRIKQVMEEKSQLSADDHWDLINDIYNPMAEQLVGLFANTLEQNNEHKHLAKYLREWDRIDNAEQIAPTLFQVINKHLARLTFSDELSSELAIQFFDSVRFWQERLILMLADNDHPWFDIQNTEMIESRDTILDMAVDSAIAELKNTLGDEPENWQWGKLHTISFLSPVIPGKTAAKWLGGGTHPMFGSGQTLNRGKYKMSQGYDAKTIDSVRIVIDLSDTKMIRSVIPGGSSGRYFDSALSNQVDDWLSGAYNPIWFDREKVRENSKTKLLLMPK